VYRYTARATTIFPSVKIEEIKLMFKRHF